MMSVKSIIAFEDKNEYLVITESEKFRITKNDFLSLEISEGDEVDDELFELLQACATKLDCIKKAFSILSYGDHSVKKLSEKLKKHFEQSVIDEVINLFIANNYLDDSAYAVRCAEYYSAEKRCGPMKIKQELYQKGFAPDDISNAMEHIDDEDYIQNAMFHIQTKYPSSDLSDYKHKQKIVTALMRIGFSYEQISDAISRLI